MTSAMDGVIKELIMDYSIGTTEHWKVKFIQRLQEIQYLSAEEFIHTFLPDEWQGFYGGDQRAIEQMTARVIDYKFKHVLLINALRILSVGKRWWSWRKQRLWVHPDCDYIMLHIERMLPLEYSYFKYIHCV
jgi:hypothetical protein